MDEDGSIQVSNNEMVERFTLAFNSIISDRAKLSKLLGKSFNGKRDYYDKLGYKKELNFDDYWTKYDRGDIAKVVIDRPVDKTWKNNPTIKEKGKAEDDETKTVFEKDIAKVINNTKLYNKLKRADKLASIGRYGVIFIGTNELKLDKDNSVNNYLKKPLEKGCLSGPEDILYLSVFSEKSAEIKEWETDPTNKRFGLPKTYEINFAGENPPEGFNPNKQLVHYSRVIHIAEELLENEVLSRPKLKNVWNRLEDLIKVVGGGAESYWRNARNKYHADIQENRTVDKNKMREQVDEMIHDLRDFIGTDGVDIKKLGADLADPKNPFEVIISCISAVTGIPQRILLGSERGELASSQDESNFLSTISERRVNYINPMVLEPLIDKFIWLGAVSEPSKQEEEGKGYELEWPSLYEKDEIEEQKENSEIAKNIAKAIKDFVSGNGELVMPYAEFREVVLKLAAEIDPKYEITEDDLIDDILDELDPEVREQFEKSKEGA